MRPDVQSRSARFCNDRIFRASFTVTALSVALLSTISCGNSSIEGPLMLLGLKDDDTFAQA